MNRLGLAASALLGLTLVWLLIDGPPGVGAGDSPVRLTAQTSLDGTIDLVTSEDRRLIYDDTTPPPAAMATVLGAAAASGLDVTLRVPGTPPALAARMDPGLTALRRSALTVTLAGSPVTEPLILEDASGGLDTLEVPEPVEGVVTMSVAIEPSRAGVSTWLLRTGPHEERLRAWVRPAADVRVLVLTGLPDWESRYLTRALEAAGMVVDVRQELGRDLSVTSGATTSPEGPGELAETDVVVLTSAPDEGLAELLDEWVSAYGGGLLRLHRSGPGSATGSASGPASEPATGEVTRVAARDLQWTGPVEIVPLPGEDGAGELDVTVLTLSEGQAPFLSPGLGHVPVASGPSGVAAWAGWKGRGRVYVSGVESWPWVMQAGLTAEHASHWESVVEWLAGGLRSPVEVAGPAGIAGEVWDGRVYGAPETEAMVLAGATSAADGATPPSAQVVPLGPADGSGRRLRFVPEAAGGYGIGADSLHGTPVVGADEPLSWSRAAMILGRSGGRVAARAEGATARSAQTLDASRMRRWLLFLILAAGMLALWMTERLGTTRPESSAP